ncbi:MAG: DNA repair exonuclease [Candidatus Altiarchaeota archaeon]|nr:DNA repair exonuclease [Candidatus Altiarchaeota archaeon]
MKIGIASDFHLGFGTGRRAGDAKRQASETMQLLVDQKVDAIIVAGDIFDTSIPTPETLRDAVDVFSIAQTKGSDTRVELIDKKMTVPIKQALAGIPVFAIHGTHERRVRGEVNPVQLMEIMGKLVYLQKNGVKLKKGKHELSIYGLGGVPESFAPKIFRAWKPNPIGQAFFVFHQNLKPFIPAPIGLTIDDLPAGFSLYIDGHLHSGQHTKNILIAGSTIVTQLRKDEQSSVWVWEDGQLTRIPLSSARAVHIIELDATDKKPDQINQELAQELSKIEISELEPIVKIKIAGKLAIGFKPWDFVPLVPETRAIVYLDRKLEGSSTMTIKSEHSSVQELTLNALKSVLKKYQLELDADKVYKAIMTEDADKLKSILEVET